MGIVRHYTRPGLSMGYLCFTKYHTVSSPRWTLSTGLVGQGAKRNIKI